MGVNLLRWKVVEASTEVDLLQWNLVELTSMEPSMEENFTSVDVDLVPWK